MDSQNNQILDYERVLKAEKVWLKKFWERVSTKVVQVKMVCVEMDETQIIEEESFGSGVILVNDEGNVLVATCGHVIAAYFRNDGSDKRIEVVFADGNMVQATPLSTKDQAEREIGVLYMNGIGLKDFPEANIVQEMTVGMKMYMASYADRLVTISHSTGYVGCSNAISYEWEGRMAGFKDLIQVHVFCSTGSSGAGLLDMDENVIGILIAAKEEGNVPEMKYGLPIAKILEAIEEVNDKEEIPQSIDWKERSKMYMRKKFSSGSSLDATSSVPPILRDYEFQIASEESLNELNEGFRQFFMERGQDE